MKMYEAIRLGSMLRPQGFGYLMDSFGRTCAIGAAYDAAGEKLQPLELARRNVFPISSVRFGTCPVCSMISTVGAVIVCLNDKLKWTREEIADWLEPIEERHHQQQQIVEKGSTSSQLAYVSA